MPAFWAETKLSQQPTSEFLVLPALLFWNYRGGCVYSVFPALPAITGVTEMRNFMQKGHHLHKDRKLPSGLQHILLLFISLFSKLQPVGPWWFVQLCTTMGNPFSKILQSPHFVLEK